MDDGRATTCDSYAAVQQPPVAGTRPTAAVAVFDTAASNLLGLLDPPKETRSLKKKAAK